MEQEFSTIVYMLTLATIYPNNMPKLDLHPVENRDHFAYCFSYK